MSMSSHTLVIATMKFVFIVHAMKAREFGDSRIQNIFFWVTFLLPLIFSMETIWTTRHVTHLHGDLNHCANRGIWPNSTEIPNSIDNVQPTDILSRFLFENDVDEPTVTFVITVAFRILPFVVFVITVSNILEGLLYFKIFKVMKR